MVDEKGMDMKVYISVIRKKLVLILILTLVATGMACLYSFRIAKSSYSATTTVIIGKDISKDPRGIITQEDVVMYQDLIKTYTQIAKSKLVAIQALESLKVDAKPMELMHNMSVISETASQVLRITYNGSSAKNAADTANAIATAFINQSQLILPSGMARVMDKADAGDTSVKPNKKQIVVLGFILGFVLSIGLAFVLDYLEDTLNNKEEVEKHLNLPMMGIIPMSSKIKKIGSENRYYINEAFKSFRTNLLVALKNKGIKTIMFSSSLLKEGKSIISSNMAIDIAQTGSRVLIIDCDFRSPSLHRFFDLSNEKGLIDVISGGANFDNVVANINDKLFVLTAGEININTPELLFTSKMKSFIQGMELKYDYVILDTSPINVFADTVALVNEKMGVVLVVNSSKTKVEVCKKAKYLLENVNATLIGVVLNKVDKVSMQGYGDGYYPYSSKREKRKSKLK